MKKTFSILVIVFTLANASSGQQVIQACCDTFVCLPGTAVPLHCVVDSGSQGQLLSIMDDTYSQVVDLGFSFTYFGNTYTQCVLSTNAYITFDISQALLYSPWPIQNAAPSPLNPLNSIYGPWHDVDPAVPPYGTMGFGTFGTAPNRFFVFNFCSVPMYSCTDVLFTGQIILYESTNIIEVHLGEKSLCSSWNSGAAIEGLQDATGSVAVVVTGRNYPSQWTAVNDGIRFTPNGNSYTISTIPYAPVPFAAGTPVWNTIDGNYVDTGYDITVHPTTTTTYVVSTASCGFSADTVTVTVGSVPATYDTLNASCIGSNDGAISVIPTDNAGPYVFVWTNQNGDTIQMQNGSVGDTVSNLGPGTYTLVFVNSLGCTQQHIYTVTQPVYGVAFGYVPFLICDGQEVSFNNLSFGDITGYTWTFGDGISSNQQSPTHTYGAPGTYNVTLTINVAPSCSATMSQVIEVHPNIRGGFTVGPPPYCVGNEIQFTDQSVGHPGQWNWSFGDGGSSTSQNPSYTYSTGGDYTVYFSASDSFCGVAKDSMPLTIYSIPQPHLRDDTILCEGTVITIDANETGDAYLWTTGDTTASIDFVMPSDSLYYLWVSVDNNGCKGYDTVALRNRCIIMLPSAFSPNNDGSNDIFHPMASNVKDFDFRVFNRWGIEVYSDNSGDISRGWNGTLNNKEQPVGVYVYVITGHFDSNKPFNVQGNVTLVR